MAILSRPVEFEAGSLFARESVSARTPSSAERELADELVGSLGPTAYARVDLLPTPDGPMLLELELTEPSLFLTTHPDAAARAAVVFRSLAG